MRNLLYKEFRLSASFLSYLFLIAAFMFLLPGYPVLCGVFFIALGIFQSFQNAREANDILFSVLLPIAKRDVVKGKYLFSCLIELCGLLLMSGCVILRMTVLADAGPYRQNALMNANFFALGLAFLIFGLFNALFIGGFFKTGYRFSGPFVQFIILGFLTIGIGEALHYFPGLGALNAFGTDSLALQLATLAAGMIAYVLITLFSYRLACRRFEIIDL